ncbi:threonylcarbamoyladenosine tRNA methylthiotransferase-like [Protopterus annectens]|uniref:threonylcarbamoyladenosine tRNA methylthiotransferase-like n=1 Tax=Protopterus annectens TaxID=7888 RepID=UPI001CFA2482|nr:threonylcarbamoyladenosine tRNA methylthiotransferase-like [Protopterus annectens]
MSGSCNLPEDIEDIVSAHDFTPYDRQTAKKDVVPKARRRSRFKQEENEEAPSSDSNIPGIQTIWIKTWGCSHNNSDGEYMAGQLAAYGYRITENPSEADLWLLNSCTVKSPAEDHFRNSIKKAQQENKKVVLAGCVPQAQPRIDYIKGLSIIGVQQIDRVVEVVEETVKGHAVRLLGQKKDNGKRLGGVRLDLPKIRKNPLIEIISINTGSHASITVKYDCVPVDVDFYSSFMMSFWGRKEKNTSDLDHLDSCHILEESLKDEYFESLRSNCRKLAELYVRYKM